MASEVTGSPSHYNAVGKKPLGKQDMHPTSDAVRFLAGSMQRLRARSITEAHHDFKCDPSLRDMSVVEHVDMEEHSQILSIEKARVHNDDGNFGKMKEVSKKTTENLDQASDFIARHAASLPKGTQTDPALVEEVLLDQQDEPPGVGYHAEIIDDLRYIAGNDHGMAKDLKELATLDGDIVKFFEKYASQYNQTAPTLLKKVVLELRAELHAKEDHEKKKEELREKTRKEFAEAYRKYHEMINSGQSSSDAMKKLKQVEDNSDEENDEDDIEDNVEDQIRSELFVESKRAPTPSTLSLTGGEEMEDDVAFFDYMEPSKRQSNIGSLAMEEKDSGILLRELDTDTFSSDVEMEDDANLNTYHHQDDLDDGLTARARPMSKNASLSPEKRRIVSIDRNPSPIKKVRGTRGIATPIKKKRNTTSSKKTPKSSTKKRASSSAETSPDFATKLNDTILNGVPYTPTRTASGGKLHARYGRTRNGWI